MRAGCVVLLMVMMGFGGVAGAAWIGYRALQEPEIAANPGTADDGVRGQQKIYDVARGSSGRSKTRLRQVVLSEPELNGFLARHLGEAGRIPLAVGTVKLVGDGVVELKGQLPLRHVLAARPLVPILDLLPDRWLERSVWLHLGTRASLEVGTARSQRRYLRLDVERFALGRQPLPEILMRLLVSPATLGLLRWRMPDTVEGITVEPGVVVVRTAS